MSSPAVLQPSDMHEGKLDPQTLAVHADRHLNETSSIAPPIYQTTTFRAASAEEFVKHAATPRDEQFYTRNANPTFRQAEAVIAALEGAEAALVTASGMAAVAAAALALLERGAHVVAQQFQYAGTSTLLRDLLPRYGVETTFIDQADPAAFEKALRPETRLMIVESPSNPLMRITDLRAVADLARARGIITLCDNTFATPLNQRPLEFGIDLVFHSATKFLSGHSDVSAGAVTGSAALVEKVWNTYLLTGPVLGPIDCWLLLRGLRTLPLRIRAHNENALALAQFLEKSPAVKAVYYAGLESHPQSKLARAQMTGFGGVLSAELAGGFEAADRLISRLKLFARATSLGGVESLIVHPASMWVKAMSEEQLRHAGIAPGLVRISVGIESEHDLIDDFRQALT